MSKPTQNPESVVAVDFHQRPRLKSIGGGLYIFPGLAGFYARPYDGRRQLQRKLKATTERLARIELGALLAQHQKSQVGFAANPFVADHRQTIRDLTEFYLSQGCPGKRGKPVGRYLTAEQKRVGWLQKWPGSKKVAATINSEDCRAYHAWRVRFVRKGRGGGRTVDLELNTLSNIFNAARRQPSKTGIEFNPLAGARERFRDARKVTHCREHMPRTGDELHALARMCFQSRDSEVFGWLILLQSIVGHRIGAMLMLRADAKTKDDPGFLSGRTLYLFRSQTHKGTCGHVDLTEQEMECLTAFHAWRAERKIKSPWYFPSPWNRKTHVEQSSLNHCLKRVASALGQGHRASHGLRAFRVNVLRGRGDDDARIALAIGHKSGGKLIVEVYGEGLDYRLEWWPTEGGPAWASATYRTT